MELTENKGNKKMQNNKSENNEVMTIDRIGESLKKKLNKFFSEWRGGMEFRFVLSSQGYRAKALGMDIEEFSEKLEELGYIKIAMTPRGQKFVFAGDCPWQFDEMQNWLMDQVFQREEEKRFNKQKNKTQKV